MDSVIELMMDFGNEFGNRIDDGFGDRIDNGFL